MLSFPADSSWAGRTPSPQPAAADTICPPHREIHFVCQKLLRFIRPRIRVEHDPNQVHLAGLDSSVLCHSVISLIGSNVIHPSEPVLDHVIIGSAQKIHGALLTESFQVIETDAGFVIPDGRILIPLGASSRSPLGLSRLSALMLMQASVHRQQFQCIRPMGIIRVCVRDVFAGQQGDRAIPGGLDRLPFGSEITNTRKLPLKLLHHPAFVLLRAAVDDENLKFPLSKKRLPHQVPQTPTKITLRIVGRHNGRNKWATVRRYFDHLFGISIRRKRPDGGVRQRHRDRGLFIHNGI